MVSFRIFNMLYKRMEHRHSRPLMFNTPPKNKPPVEPPSIIIKNIDSPYFNHIRNKKNTIMEIMDLYNKTKK
jgi:hypothetical protein